MPPPPDGVGTEDGRKCPLSRTLGSTASGNCSAEGAHHVWLSRLEARACMEPEGMEPVENRELAASEEAGVVRPSEVPGRRRPEVAAASRWASRFGVDSEERATESGLSREAKSWEAPRRALLGVEGDEA
jgi:hypothetical protein